MADSPANTIRDLITGFNSMSAQLGLTPMSAQGGYTMPVTPMPPMKHPGQVSSELMQFSSQQMQATVQAGAQIRHLPSPGVLGLQPAALMPSPGGAQGAYAEQYQQRMQQIEGNYLTPYQAQGYAGMQGQPGFAGLPSPIFRTAPSMGIYRPNMATPPPVGLAREQPFIPTPFTPTLPSPMFQQPWQQTYQQDQLNNERMFSATMAAAPTAAYVGAGALTTAIGGAIGGRFGTLGRIGGLAAGAAAGFGLVGKGAERATEVLGTEPLVNMRAMGRQLEQVSQQFVVGGAELNQTTGQGLSAKASVGLANKIQRDVAGGNTAGFNMRDMMSMTGMAADTGMLDMAQSGEQIANQMRNVARGLQSFMRIAQEPDIRKAMQQMSSFRTMGLTIPESNVAASNAVQFARMAGVSPQVLAATAGAPGAMTFQQLGMTAGLGFQVGGAAAGLGQQAIAGGAFNPAQLAMAGGKSGVTQTLTEAAGAGLGVDFPILSMLTRNARGQLTIDQDKARDVMSGKMTLAQQAQEGAENVNKLGGERVIMELSTRMNELRDQLGRQLGPQSSVLLAMRQATNLMSEVPGMSMGGALQHLGMSMQQARTIELMGESPQFWKNVRQQSDVNITQLRAEESARREQQMDASTLWGRTKSWWQEPGILDAARDSVRSAATSVSQWFTDRSERLKATEEGATYAPPSETLTVRSQGVQREVDRFIRSGGNQRYDAMLGAQNQRGAGPTFGEQMGGLWNTALGVGSTAAGVVGGPLGGIGASAISGALESGAPADSRYVAALKARGGIGGTLAGMMPGLTALGGNEALGAIADYEARGAAKVSQGIQAGMGMTDKQAVATRVNLHKHAQAVAQSLGQTLGKNADVHGLAVTGVLGMFKKKAGLTKWGHEAPTDDELKKAAIESIVAGGAMTREAAKKHVDSTWEVGGLREDVLRSAKQQATGAAKASIAKAEEAGSYTGKITGENVKDVEEKIENLEQGVMMGLGASASGLLGTSKKSEEAYKEHAMTRSSEEMLYLQAKALGLESEEGKRITDRLREKLGVEEFAKLEQTGAKIELGDAEKSFAGAGKTSAQRDTKDMFNVTEFAKKTFLGGRARTQLGRGAASFSEGLQGAFRAIGSKGVEGAEETLQNLLTDPNARQLLEKESPELAKLLEEYKGAEGDTEKRTDIGRRFAAITAGIGAKDTKSKYGGKGAGGEAEGKAREAQGVAESIEESIKQGKPQEAFAKAIPMFADAASDLKESTKKMNDMTGKLSLALKLGL